MTIDTNGLDFDRLLPPNLPANVSRTREGGLPTKVLMDWEAYQTAALSRAAANLNDRVVTMSETVGDVSGQVQEIIDLDIDDSSALIQRLTSIQAAADTAKGEADDILALSLDPTSALAVKLTQLTTQFGSISASGKIVFRSVAAPSGALAAYEIALVASDGVTTTSTGLTLVAASDGTSYVAIRASGFYLTDPNLPGGFANVLNYNTALGAFAFGVPVKFAENQIIPGATNDFRQVTYSSKTLAGSTGGAYVQGVIDNSTLTLTLATKTAVLVSGAIQYAITGTGGSGANFGATVFLNGNPAITGYSTYGVFRNTNDPLNNVPQSFQGSFVLPAGTHTIDLRYAYQSNNAGVTFAFAAQNYNVFLFRNVS